MDKALGVGGTELFLRYLAWLACRNDNLVGKNIAVIVGPGLELAINLINRLKGLFKPDPSFVFEEKQTVCYLNGCRFECYPSNHSDAMRGLTDLAAILYDEADFFSVGQEENVLHLATRYAIKNNPVQIMISTPNRPGSLFDRIEHDPDSMFCKVYWPYTIALNKIYTVQEVEAVRKQPGFAREMELAYGGQLGNAFPQELIDKAVELGKDPIYDYDNSQDLRRRDNYRYNNPASLGIDPGYGSSNFGICLTQIRENKVYVIYALEYERPSFVRMADYVANVMRAFANIRCYIDASEPEFISEVKGRLNEATDYHPYIARKWRELMLPPGRNPTLEHFMKVIPVDFRSQHENMLSKARTLLELQQIVIPSTKLCEKLVIALRTAQINENRLDKSQTTFDDCLDSFRLSLQRYQNLYR